MIGVYFSGTGNTKFCIEYFINGLDKSAKCYSIEDENVTSEILKSENIVLAYPIYYSNLPKIVKDFIYNNSKIWKGKKVYIIATMGLFSGDGAGLSARILKKFGAKIIGGLHLKMPDCVGDVKALKKTLSKNKEVISQAKIKMDKALIRYKTNKPTQDGMNIFDLFAGLFCQRLYFLNKTSNYSDKLKIDTDKCIGCGKCAVLCPMNSISIRNGKAVPKDSCTMCYRCISNCPKQAITLIGKQVIEQCKIEKYLN